MPILGMEEDDIDLASMSYGCSRNAVMLVEDLRFLYRTGNIPLAILLGFSCISLAYSVTKVLWRYVADPEDEDKYCYAKFRGNLLADLNQR